MTPDEIRTVGETPTRAGADVDAGLPVCALCRVRPGAWTVGGLAFCATCEGVFGLDGCLRRVGRADDGSGAAAVRRVPADQAGTTVRVGPATARSGAGGRGGCSVWSSLPRPFCL